MTAISDAIRTSLADTPVGFERFQTLAIRLLDTGVIKSGDSQYETELYDDAVRVEPLLADYLGVLGCHLVHDRIYEYFRAYPPGADIPGVETGEEENLPRALRLQLGQNEVAAALVFRFLYGEAAAGGELDEDGEALVTLEAFNTTMATQLTRTQPTAVSERRAILGRLRALKLVHFASDIDLNDPDARLTIRPLITSLVHEHTLQELLAGDADETAATADDDGTTTASEDAGAR